MKIKILLTRVRRILDVQLLTMNTSKFHVIVNISITESRNPTGILLRILVATNYETSPKNLYEERLKLITHVRHEIFF